MITVKVKQAGQYNGPGHKRRPFAQVGDVIEVASAPYAQSLVNDGLADWLDAEEKAEPVPPTPATAVDESPPSSVSQLVAAQRETASALPVRRSKKEDAPKNEPKNKAKPEPTQEDEPDDFATIIRGIGLGPSRTRELHLKGILTLADLAAADSARLVQLMEVSQKTIDKWIAAAQAKLEEMAAGTDEEE